MDSGTQDTPRPRGLDVSWHYFERNAGNARKPEVTWHCVRHEASESVCGSYGASVLRGGIFISLSQLQMAARRSGHNICQRCADAVMKHMKAMNPIQNRKEQ